MKHVFALFMCTALAFAFQSKKHKTFTPPGTVQINDTLYVDQKEISNLSWKEYENWTRNMFGANSPEHRATLPDTSVWLWGGMNSNHPFQESYSLQKVFRDHPVVGISCEQAQAFCKWRTERVKFYMSIDGHYPNIAFEYRLPSTAEWVFASNGSGEAFANMGNIERKKVSATTTIVSGGMSANVLQYSDEVQHFSFPCGSFKASHLGLYDMTGNVAEMVQEKGICKGGSWHHSPEQCRNGLNISYSAPTAWLGFRCVCVIHNIKKTS
jgi:formylglycine-generating enzyme required for sulfatase activity